MKEHRTNSKNIFKEYSYWKGENNSKWEEKSESELISGSITNCIKILMIISIDSSIKLPRCKMKLIHWVVHYLY